MPRGNQGQFDGVKGPANKKLEKKAKIYEEARNRRLNVLREELSKKAELVLEMQKAKIAVYNFEDGEDVRITLTDTKIGVEVKRTALESE